MTDRILSDLLIEAAARFPDRPAVVEPPDTVVSYRELLELAHRVRSRLQAMGIEPGNHVAICLPKSIDAVAVMCGVLLAGAVCAPIDPMSPRERAAIIVRDAAIALLVTTSSLAAELFDGQNHATIALPFVGGGRGIAGLAMPATTAVEPRDRPTVTPASAAHLLYTSGSTGRPKGIVMSHAAAIAFVDWFTTALATTSSDRFASHAPFHFAMSIFDIFMAQRNGGALVLIDDATARDPLSLAPLIERQQLSIWFSTPSILVALEQYGHLERHDASSLRFVLFAGEAFPMPALRRLMEKWPLPRYVNLFGATETNVRFWYEVPRPLSPDAHGPLPIGRPLDHFRTLVMDGPHLAAPGESGELLLSGPGILTEYWGNPTLTSGATHVDAQGTRWFRTGDVVAQQPDGSFLFRGRQDRMVKRRGFRIELAEIELALSEHPELQSVAVVAIPDTSTGVRIVGVVTRHDDRASSIIELKQYCMQRLPAYMIPDRFIQMERIPLTSTGKTDYQSLIDTLTDR